MHVHKGCSHNGAVYQFIHVIPWWNLFAKLSAALRGTVLGNWHFLETSVSTLLQRGSHRVNNRRITLTQTSRLNQQKNGIYNLMVSLKTLSCKMVRRQTPLNLDLVYHQSEWLWQWANAWNIIFSPWYFYLCQLVWWNKIWKWLFVLISIFCIPTSEVPKFLKLNLHLTIFPKLINICNLILGLLRKNTMILSVKSSSTMILPSIFFFDFLAKTKFCVSSG